MDTSQRVKSRRKCTSVGSFLEVDAVSRGIEQKLLSKTVSCGKKRVDVEENE